MIAARGWKLIRFTITAVFMFAIWLVFTAGLDPFILTTGAIGATVVAALSYDAFIAKHQANLRFVLPNPLFAIISFFYVLASLYLSSVKTLVAVITGKATPRIVHFKTALRSDLSRMALATFITFTPGTITLDLNDDHLTVHWFFSTTRHSRAAGDAIKNRLERLLGKVWP